jgi:hypothetical protein
MPLSSGTSKQARQKNIETEIAHGKDPKQAVAIGYAKQRSNVASKSHHKDGVRDDAVVKRLIADLRDSIKNLAGGMDKVKDGGPGSGPHKGERVGVKKAPQASAPQATGGAAAVPTTTTGQHVPAPVASAMGAVRRAQKGYL